MAIAPQIVDLSARDNSLDQERILDELHRDGYVLLRNGMSHADEILPALGSVVDDTHVEVDDERPGLVTSHQELGLHTDHGDVDYIVLVCRKQTERGGESILVDGHRVLEKLDEATKEALGEVYLTEHKVFPDDPERRPMLHKRDGAWRLYYSFWLLEEELSATGRAAVDAFRKALEDTEVTRFKLAPGDVLILDNTRMLHGRTAIEGDDERLLERYWIQKQSSPRQHSKTRHGESTVLLLPEPISEERIAELKAGGIDPDVAAIDLSMVKMKLQDEDEGKGWTPAECDEAEVEYKRYLTLNLRYEDKAIVPTKQMDTMWHYHILDTRAYHRDTEAVFGEYFHHFPYFGMRGDEDAENLKNSFFETVELYEAEFGESMLRNQSVATDCWHDCQGRCWNACSD